MNPILTADEVLAYSAKTDRERLERDWLDYWRTIGGPEPERQYRIVPGRRWAWDFAWPKKTVLEFDVEIHPLRISPGVAVEVQGGTYSKKNWAHRNGMQQHDGFLKHNAASALGWRIWFFDAKSISSRIGFRELMEVLMSTGKLTDFGFD